jgi:hypothetical protein
VWQKQWVSGQLAAGTHTLTIRHASGSYVDIDAVIVSEYQASQGYQIQPGSPAYISNFAHPELGSNWMGVAGQVFDINGDPILDMVVVIDGNLNGRNVDALTLTGMADAYGPGGYEIQLDQVPGDSNGTLFISLYDLSGNLLIGRTPFSTFNDPQKNLILINFQQISAP